MAVALARTHIRNNRGSAADSKREAPYKLSGEGDTSPRTDAPGSVGETNLHFFREMPVYVKLGKEGKYFCTKVIYGSWEAFGVIQSLKLF